MPLTKVLITVKTYPTISSKYVELVCTAGFKEDGSWIRIHPVPFRMLDHEKQWYKKWQWIEVNLVKNTKDFRKESYRIENIDSLNLLDPIDTIKKPKWELRREFVFKNKSVDRNLTDLIARAKKDDISFSVFKPKEIIGFDYAPVDTEWNKIQLDKVKGRLMQQDMFEEVALNKSFEIAKKIPYVFSYTFTTDDGKKPHLMIEDWEIGQLYLNCLKDNNYDEKIACEKVKEKYLKLAKERDIYLFLGTRYKHHKIGKNPFLIIGTFTPPFEDTAQKNMFW